MEWLDELEEAIKKMGAGEKNYPIKKSAWTKSIWTKKTNIKLSPFFWLMKWNDSSMDGNISNAKLKTRFIE